MNQVTTSKKSHLAAPPSCCPHSKHWCLASVFVHHIASCSEFDSTKPQFANNGSRQSPPTRPAQVACMQNWTKAIQHRTATMDTQEKDFKKIMQLPSSHT